MPATTSRPGQYPTWTSQLLNALGVPDTPDNERWLTLWAGSEGTAQSNNPLAISGSNPGATNCLAQCGTSSPVYAYDTMDHGLAATANFIKAGYPQIIQAFSQSGGTGNGTSVFSAINGSAWCKGCQSGRYPTYLYEDLAGVAIPGNIFGASGGGTGPLGFPNATPDCSQQQTIGIAGVNIWNACRTRALVGGGLMVIGGVTMLLGVGVILASLGLGKSPAKAVVGFAAGRATKRSAPPVDTSPDEDDEIAEAEGIGAPGRGGNRGGPGARSTMNKDLTGSRERYVEAA